MLLQAAVKRSQEARTPEHTSPERAAQAHAAAIRDDALRRLGDWARPLGGDKCPLTCPHTALLEEMLAAVTSAVDHGRDVKLSLTRVEELDVLSLLRTH